MQAMNWKTALTLGGLVCATGAWAQTSDCASFAAAALPGMTLTTEAVAGDSTRPPGVSTGPMLVAHCKVSGKMAERMGQDGKPYHIGFELRLPTAWNGRFLYQGGGGNDGVVRPAVGPQAAPGYALNRGFAVVTTDAGHGERGPVGSGLSGANRESPRRVVRVGVDNAEHL